MNTDIFYMRVWKLMIVYKNKTHVLINVSYIFIDCYVQYIIVFLDTHTYDVD